MERLSSPSIEARFYPQCALSKEPEGIPGKEEAPGERPVLAAGPSRPVWAEDIWKYLHHRDLPDDDKSAECIARRAKMYVLVNGELYRRWENGVLLRCISREEGQELLTDIHKGLCSHHVASRAMAEKAMRQGFYWPTAVTDAEYIGKTCEACQYHPKSIHQPAEDLQTIPLSWPFAVLGLGVVGNFP